MFTFVNATPIVRGAKALQSNRVDDFDRVGGDFVAVTSDVEDGDSVRVPDVEGDNDEVSCSNNVGV